MTEHRHSTYQDWCYRCELSRVEAKEDRDAIEARRAAHDHDGLVALLAMTGGNLDEEIDRVFIADEILESRWFVSQMGLGGFDA